jgi:hypothetical protein
MSFIRLIESAAAPPHQSSFELRPIQLPPGIVGVGGSHNLRTCGE